MPDPHTNFHYPMINELMNYWIWSHICYPEHSLHMRRVRWPITRGQKWSTLSLSGCYNES